MPFCSRCLGASIGHIIAAICYFLFYLPPFSIAFVGLFIMLVDWYLQNEKKLYHSNFTRLITGSIGGFSVGLFIWACVEYLRVYFLKI